MQRFIPTLALAAAVLLHSGTGWSEDDIFAFVPDGGRTLLGMLMEQGAADDVAPAIATREDGPEGWSATLQASPGAAELDTWQIDTLAHYLATNAPFDPDGALPQDGRDMTLNLCQSCHIVTVVVTQDRTREAWLGTLHKPSHIEIEMTEAERGALADYLVINGGIPIDLVPPALRAGGASY